VAELKLSTAVRVHQGALASACASEILLKSGSPFNAALVGASGRALVALGDQRGLAVLEQANMKLTSPRAIPLLQQLEQQLKQKGQTATPKTPGD
jgi:lysophospholipase L1-like esterase